MMLDTTSTERKWLIITVIGCVLATTAIFTAHTIYTHAVLGVFLLGVLILTVGFFGYAREVIG